MEQQSSEDYYKEIFQQYTEIEFKKENEFTIIHFYPEENAYPNGYREAKWLQVKLFNPKTKEMSIIPRRQDALFFKGDIVSTVSVFIDGSTCITLKNSCRLEDVFQASTVVDSRRHGLSH